MAAKLQDDLLEKTEHLLLFNFYKNLITLRKMIASFVGLNNREMTVVYSEKFKYLFLNRWDEDDEICLVFHLGPERCSFRLPVPEGNWSKLIDSAEVKWGGNGSQIGPDIVSDGEVDLEFAPYCFVLFQRM